MCAALPLKRLDFLGLLLLLFILKFSSELTQTCPLFWTNIEFVWKMFWALILAALIFQQTQK